MADIIHYSVTVTQPEEADLRYRTLVVLARSDRASNHPYCCHRCGRPVAEIVNGKVASTSDVFDMENTGSLAIGRRCYGKYYDEVAQKMVNCRYWYYFLLN